MRGLAEIGEAEATGRVAELYEDIRRVLGVPFVVLIYRVLATEPARLEQIWGELAPNLASGFGRRAAAELGEQAGSWAVAPVAPALRRRLDPAAVRATLDGFRRANSANLLGLTAVLAGVEGAEPADAPAGSPRPLGAALPMADLRGLPGATLELLERMSAPVAGTERPLLIPSLFRYFAHDHALLEGLWERLQPVLEGPSFAPAVSALVERAGILAVSLPFRVTRLDDAALRVTVERFVRTIPAMIVTGTLIEQALDLQAQGSG